MQQRFTRRRLAAAISAISLAGVALEASIAAAPSAQAACVSEARWTDYYPANSETWTIPSYSTCNDLNASYTWDVTDDIRGWYYVRSIHTWRVGTRGFVTVPHINKGLKILLSSIINGSTVRGEALNHSQYVQYVD